MKTEITLTLNSLISLGTAVVAITSSILYTKFSSKQNKAEISRLEEQQKVLGEKLAEKHNAAIDHANSVTDTIKEEIQEKVEGCLQHANHQFTLHEQGVAFRLEALDKEMKFQRDSFKSITENMAQISTTMQTISNKLDIHIASNEKPKTDAGNN